MAFDKWKCLFMLYSSNKKGKEFKCLISGSTSESCKSYSTPIEWYRGGCKHKEQPMQNFGTLLKNRSVMVCFL